MKRQLVSLALALALCLSLTVPAVAEFPASEEEAKELFSLTRNSEDELADKFLTNRKITLVNELTSPAESREDFYRVISASDSWEVTHTGGNDCTIWVSLNTYVLENGEYSLSGHDAWRENKTENRSCFVDTAQVDGEGGYYVVNLNQGESISFSAEDFLAEGDQDEGGFVYELGVNMEFAGEQGEEAQWASYSVVLVRDEDAAADIENGNTSGKPDTPALSVAAATNVQFVLEDGVPAKVTWDVLVGLNDTAPLTFDLAIYGAKDAGLPYRPAVYLKSIQNEELDGVLTVERELTQALSHYTYVLDSSWTPESLEPDVYTVHIRPVGENNRAGDEGHASWEKMDSSGGSETVTIKPTVTATPTRFDVGTTEVKVTLKSADVSFALHLDENMFIVDSGTTRLSLVSVSPARNPGSDGTVWCDAVLTFTDTTYVGAHGPAQAGELKITAKSSAFVSPNAATVVEDAAPVTITISNASSGGDDTPDNPNPPVTPSRPDRPSGDTSGSSGSTTTRPATPDTVTNPDGSTTTTRTDKATGTVTETTKAADGSQTVVETRADGTVTTTATDAAGNRTATVENPDGSTVTTVANRDGGASTTTISAGGQVTAAVTAPASAVAAAQAGGQAVALPMPEVPLTANAAAAPVVTVTTGSSQPVKVEIPVERTTPGTVAVIVNADGTETVVKTSLAAGNGVTLTAADGATVKIVDNSRSFADTASHWAGDAITFAAAHELFNGTGADSFTPNGTMTRGMLVTVLARYDGVDTSAGATWYEKGVEWAAANSISSGADLDAPVSREQLVTMLYRYAASSGLDTSAGGALTGFADAGSVSGYAASAMAWAVGTGLISGNADGELAPQSSATRAEVAVILMRFCENVMK